jgi:hypothetical protein
MNEKKLIHDWRLSTSNCPNNSNDCPSAEELQARLRGVDLGERNSRVVSALANCARCASIAQFGAALAQDDSMLTPARSLPQRRSRTWLQSTAVAASLLLSFGVVGWIALSSLRPDDSLRTAQLQVQPADGSVVQALPEFAWTATGSCELEIRDNEGTLHARVSSITSSRYQAKQALAPGTYLWTVRCLTQSQGPFRFELRP